MSLFMTNKKTIEDIERLAQICRKEETNLLIGRYELTLNQSVIQFITNEYKLNSNNNNINIKLNFLKQLIRKIPSLKIIGDNSSLNQVIHLNQFISCICLQLVRISFKDLVGLEIIRPQLKSLKCFKCFDTQSLDEEFWDLFGVWPQLTSLTLSRNDIISVKASIIPSSVEILDLSWNRIKSFNNISNFSVNNISKLDLSYNCLKQVPKLNTFSCCSLKSLFIRGNLIEDITGIERLTQIIELDVGINCVVDLNSFVSCLKKCKSLKVLWIDGNPFTCDPNSNEFIRKELNFLIKLNEINISKDNKNIDLTNRTNILLQNEGLKTNSDEESEQFFDASSDSIDAKSDTKNDMNRKKKSKLAQIKEPTDIGPHLLDPETKSNDSNDKNVENLSEAKKMIEKRKELGEDWLRSSLEDSLTSESTLEVNSELNTPSAVNQSIASNINTSSEKTAEKSDRKISTISTYTTDDEIEVLAPEKTSWSNEELENDTNIVIVENSETNETFFVYVREEDGMIFEKDCTNGKVLRTHDLKVLTNVEIINDLELKICFDSRINSKREVKYRFDSTEFCRGFNEKFIIPWISRKKQQKISEETLYECLKCGQIKSSAIQVVCCALCGSDAIMQSESLRKRRSGSDITILSPPQNLTEVKSNFNEEINVWEELFSINSYYDNSFFTRVEHSLKLYIEVKLFTSSEEEEVIEGLIKCKAMTEKQNRLESAFLVISNKNIWILTINETENYDNFDAYLKLQVSKPITSLINFKTFPNLLTDQGFWLEFKDDKITVENRSRTKSLLNRFGSKRCSIPDSNTFNCLIVFFDQIIGKSFINYFNETINKLRKIPNSMTKGQAIHLTENSIALNDDIIVINVIKSAEYKRNDMRNELKLSENIAIIVTEELVILGEIDFNFKGFYNIKVLYKEFIINLMPQIYVNLQNNCTKLLFSDDSIEINFTINSYTSDSIKTFLIPIKSQWEKAFDVSLPLYQF